MKFTKEILSGKSLEELQSIAAEYGIKPGKKNELALMYEILDKSAVESAASAQEKSGARKRTRMKTVDHVYSASKDNAVKVDDKKRSVAVDTGNDLFSSLPRLEHEAVKPEKPAATETAKQESAPSDKVAEEPKKRGRKAADKSQPKDTNEAAAAAALLAGLVPDDDIDEGVQLVDDTIVVRDEPKAAPADKSDDKPVETAPVEEAPKKKRGRPRKNPLPETGEESVAAAETKVVEPAPEKAAEPAEKPAKAKKPAKQDDYDDGSDFIVIQDIEPIDFSDEPVRTSFEPQEPDFKEENRDIAEPDKAKNAETPVRKPEPAKVRQTYDFANIITTTGVLDIVDGYGYLRSSDYNYLSSPDDVFVNPSMVRHFGLKTGDVVEGPVRPPKDNEKFFTLVNVVKINGCEPPAVRDRVPFEYLTPLFPDEKFNLCSGKNDSYSSRIVDLFAPIGKGQRALIVAQPKTGKTLLMKDIANSIAKNHPEAYLMMLLIDERPEEVTDMARTVNAEVIASTFDAPAENHVKIANLVLEKAKRMVECGHDVVIFLDSITRLARAYNTVSPASGKVLTGGVDANALQKPKRFFGAARNIEGGGSLTIIATALIDTGSKMDEVIFEEFKGTGNMELQLDRSLSNKRIFPSVNLVASSTRRDDLLQDDNTRRRMWVLRKHISDMNVLEAMDVVMGHIERTVNNEEFLLSMNS